MVDFFEDFHYYNYIRIYSSISRSAFKPTPELSRTKKRLKNCTSQKIIILGLKMPKIYLNTHVGIQNCLVLICITFIYTQYIILHAEIDLTVKFEEQNFKSLSILNFKIVQKNSAYTRVYTVVEQQNWASIIITIFVYSEIIIPHLQVAKR